MSQLSLARLDDRKMSLRRLHFVALLVLTVVLTAAFVVVFANLRATALRVGDERRQRAAVSVREEIEHFLAPAERAIHLGASLLEKGVLRTESPKNTLAFLHSVLMDEPNFTEAAWIFENSGEPDHAVYVAAERRSAANSRPETTIHRRFERRTQGRWFSQDDSASDPYAGTEFPDPTKHLTYKTPRAPEWRGRILWTDLAFAASDVALPESQRRIVVSALSSPLDPAGRDLGVFRISLDHQILNQRLRDLPQHLGLADHVLFIVDDEGRRLTSPGTSDHVVDQVGDLRQVDLEQANDHPMGEVLDLLKTRSSDDNTGRLKRHPWYFSAVSLSRGYEWRIVVMAPESVYLGDLEKMIQNLIGLGVLVIAFLAGAGLLVLGRIGRDLRSVESAAESLRDFEFTKPIEATGRFSELRAALNAVDTARTALQSMGLYVPMDIVRGLTHGGRVPELGAEERCVTVLFSDIADFTTHTENMPPGDLAQALGLYFTTIDETIRASGGVIDKFVGDAVMALWNAPAPLEHHAACAARAVLEISTRLDQLFASDAWGQRPRFVTRFGLHSGAMLVGNFGARNRFSYTALGDGVNLAARLEALNKLYGTHILVSGAFADVLRNISFRVRKIDHVAVKGQTQVTTIHELLSPLALEDAADLEVFDQAFAAYERHEFSLALAAFENLPKDPVACLLKSRCRELIEAGPDLHWDGVFRPPKV